MSLLKLWKWLVPLRAAHLVWPMLFKDVVRDDIRAWTAHFWKGGARGLFSKGGVYFCCDFPMGADSVLFSYSSLLVYKVSAKGQTLAPFPPDTNEGKNKGKAWAWRSPGRARVTRKCAICIYLFDVWFWILWDPQGLGFGRLRRTFTWSTIWLATSPGLCFTLLAEMCFVL